MKLSERIVYAAIIILLDLLVFVLPIMAFVLAYVILARPRWFREWVLRLYEDVSA